jgi:hypothetical protein
MEPCRGPGFRTAGTAEKRRADGGLASLNGHYVEKFLARQPEWRQLRDQKGALDLPSSSSSRTVR